MKRRDFIKFSAVSPFMVTPLLSNTQDKILLTKSNQREYIHDGWMDLHQSFHYFNYDSVEDMGYGVLRVIDDFNMRTMTGTKKHPHKNMEIISIITSGHLFHEDSLGNSGVLRAGDVQLMSAGSGIEHAETNPSRFSDGHGFQIWISPSIRDTKPHYQEMNIPQEKYHNQLFLIASPQGENGSLKINQNGYLMRGVFDKNIVLNYMAKESGNGYYIFVIDGNIKVDDIMLEPRDGLGINSGKAINIEISKGGDFLLFDIPMNGKF